MNPTTYVTRTSTGWQLHHQGMPLTAANRSLADCFAVAARMKLEIAAQVWISALERWGTLAEAKEQP